MSSSSNKTQPSSRSPEDFINDIDHERKRREGFELLEMFREETGTEPVLWGPSIIGYGCYHYKYDSGREGDFMRVGFSPRKSRHSIYLTCKPLDYDDLLAQLGKYKTGASCLYINKLADINKDVLRTMIRRSWEKMKKEYPEDPMSDSP